MPIGAITEFNIKDGNWRSYCDRIDMYFKVNDIKSELQLPVLISAVGDVTYELMVNLCNPKKPAELTYKDVVELVQKHLQPKPSVLAERYLFRQCRQGNEQSIAQFVELLKKKARFCEFKDVLNDNLRDQLVCGIASDGIRQRLFAEEQSMTFTKALSLALSLEAAERNASAVENSREAVNLNQVAQDVCLSVNQLHTATGCAACGDTRHTKNDCRYRNYVCDNCNLTGHLRRMCVSIRNGGGSAGLGPSAGSGAGGGRRRGARGGGRSRGARARAPRHNPPQQQWRREAHAHGGHSDAHWVRSDDHGATEQSDEEYYDDEPVYQMSLGMYKPVSMKLNVNDQELLMEVDTGSALSCVSEEMYREKFSHLPLQRCKLMLRFYDGSRIKPMGYVQVSVKHQNVYKELDLYIISKGTTSLLGRQWLAELNISVPKISVHNMEPFSCKYQGNEGSELVKNLVFRHKQLFDGGLGRYTGERARLRLRAGAEPVFCRARPMPYALRERVDAELDAMLRAGVIEPVEHSDWATPLVIVHKPDGSLRVCADYKITLNRVLLVDKFPVPKIEDLFANLSGGKYFTKLDLSQAYNQILLDDDSTALTVINTHRGLFKYKRLVFGLASSPGVFQRIMCNLMKDIPDVTVYLDDILIKSDSIENHMATLELVLRALSQHGLKIKQQKCEILAKEVRYLGFVIDKSGVRVDSDKVQPILDMTAPNNVSELKSFLGMVNFYGKFIRNLSEQLAPLYELLKKHRRWSWLDRQERAFAKVKQLLTSTGVLAHYDLAQPLVLTCDASPHGLGAVLAQRGPAGRERVVAYASRALTPPERNYSQIHKEALGIIFAVKKFHQYLYGRRFTLRTDHKPLVSIFGPEFGIPSMTASRLQRWALILSAYDFAIEYVKSDDNTADALSRLIAAHKAVGAKEQEMPEQTYLHFASEALLLDYKKIRTETRRDPILCRVLSYVRDGWPKEIDIKELKPYFNRRSELYTELDCIMWGHRVVIPQTCRDKVLQELHDSHMGVVKTKSLARSYAWWPGVDEAVEAQCRQCTVCAVTADAPSGHSPCLWDWPNRVWSRTHLDFLGPFEGSKYLVLVDASSKWIEIVKMNVTTANMVIRKLREIFARFGIPKQIVSDNGPPFSSEEFRGFCESNGIEHLFSAPYHPSSNGAAENAVKLCKKIIKKAIHQRLEVETALNRFLLMYRNAEHQTTGDSPAQLLLGRAVRTRLDCLKPDREKRVEARQRQQKSAAGGSDRELTVGEGVWYRQFGGHIKWAKGKVLERLGETDYRVKTNEGTIVHRHIDQLRGRDLSESEASSDFTTSLETARSGSRLPPELMSLPAPGPAGEASAPAHASVPPPQPGSAVDEHRYPIRERRPPVRYGFDFD